MNKIERVVRLDQGQWRRQMDNELRWISGEHCDWTRVKFQECFWACYLAPTLFTVLNQLDFTHLYYLRSPISIWVCDSETVRERRTQNLSKGPFPKGLRGVRQTRREGCPNSPGCGSRKIKLTVSNAPERASQDTGCQVIYAFRESVLC